MGRINRPAAKGCALAAAVLIGVPLLVVGVVGVKTWAPLQEAGRTLDELEQFLGGAAAYVPAPSGEIAPDRMEVFLELRAVLVAACQEYGAVRKGFDSVETLEEKDPEDLSDMGGVFKDLGGASLSITPFLARFFERRNEALLGASMGLSEYCYIYAMAYHDQLLSEQTRGEIFSDGDAVSPEASEELRGCLARQLEGMGRSGGESPDRTAMEAELERMAADPARLIWQDGLPVQVRDSISPHRDRLERLFCSATAGLEMERGSGRALKLALE